MGTGERGQFYDGVNLGEISGVILSLNRGFTVHDCRYFHYLTPVNTIMLRLFHFFYFVCRGRYHLYFIDFFLVLSIDHTIPFFAAGFSNQIETKKAHNGKGMGCLYMREIGCQYMFIQSDWVFIQSSVLGEI